MNIKIRNCSSDDFEGVQKLLQQLWPGRNFNVKDLREVYERALSSPNQKLMAAAGPDRIVGFCSLTIKNNLWQAANLGVVDELVVDAEYRGFGIGKMLMEKITQIAIENECKRLELDSSSHRKEAHQFYERLGFKSRAFWFSKEL
jgi:ribosomal protein S18 acetylase RimI-like enzyme